MNKLFNLPITDDITLAIPFTIPKRHLNFGNISILVLGTSLNALSIRETDWWVTHSRLRYVNAIERQWQMLNRERWQKK